MAPGYSTLIFLAIPLLSSFRALCQSLFAIRRSDPADLTLRIPADSCGFLRIPADSLRIPALMMSVSAPLDSAVLRPLAMVFFGPYERGRGCVPARRVTPGHGRHRGWLHHRRAAGECVMAYVLVNVNDFAFPWGLGPWWRTDRHGGIGCTRGDIRRCSRIDIMQEQLIEVVDAITVRVVIRIGGA